MPQRNVASNFTFEQQRVEINNLAQDFWTQKGTVDTAAPTYLKHDGSNDFTGQTLAVPNAFTINANGGNGTVTISGNLDVTGTTTTVSSANLEVTDKNILISKGSTTDAQADGAGITIDSATDITFNFVDAKDALVSSIGLEATTHLKAARGQFIGATSPTTGSGVEVNAPDANTGQIIAYNRDTTAYNELRFRGSSVGVYTGSTNALAGTFNSTGLILESGKSIGIGDTTGSQSLIIKDDDPRILLTETTNNSNCYLDYAAGGILEVSVDDNNVDTGSKFQVRIDGATAAMTLDSTGLGVGTTSPTNALDVQGGGTNTAIVARSTDAKAAISFVDNTTTGVGSCAVGAEGDDLFLTSGSGGAERIRIEDDGKIKFITNTTSDYLQYGNNPRLWLKVPSGTNGLRIDASTTPLEIKNSNNDGKSISVDSNFNFNVSADYSLTAGQYDSSGKIFLNATRHNGTGTVTAFQTSIQAVATSNANNTGYLGFGSSATPDDLVIKTDGTVGIGHVSPTELLSLGFADDSSAKIEFRVPSRSKVAMIEGADDTAAINDGNVRGSLRFITRLAGNENERMRINSDGKVGINITDNTTADLHVRTGVNGAGIFRLGGGTGGATGLDIDYTNAGTTKTIIKQNYRSTNGEAELSFDSGLITFMTGTTGNDERLRINKNGYITTPTSSPIASKGANSKINGGFEVYNDQHVIEITDNTNSYHVMRSWRATKWGEFRVEFEAMIQSGAYYFAYDIFNSTQGKRISANGTGNETQDNLNNCRWTDHLDTGFSSSVHAMKRFSVTCGADSPVAPGDVIELRMASTNSNGTLVTGNGQILKCEHLQIFNDSPGLETGGRGFQPSPVAFHAVMMGMNQSFSGDLTWNNGYTAFNRGYRRSNVSGNPVNAGFDIANSRFIVPYTGIYAFYVNMFVNTASSCRMAITIDGSAYQSGYIWGCNSDEGQSTPNQAGFQTIYLGAGSNIKLKIVSGTLSDTYGGHTSWGGWLIG